MLRDQGHKELAFHAGMDSIEKAAIQNRFMTEPGIVMVATIAFGMGIDKPDIRYVLHTDLPASLKPITRRSARGAAVMGRRRRPCCSMGSTISACAASSSRKPRRPTNISGASTNGSTPNRLLRGAGLPSSYVAPLFRRER